jgi:hypothetical protein
MEKAPITKSGLGFFVAHLHIGGILELKPTSGRGIERRINP